VVNWTFLKTNYITKIPSEKEPRIIPFRIQLIYNKVEKKLDAMRMGCTSSTHILHR
jgi:hypothetical protein